MGADEKHAATYHGAYTPNVDELRDAWVDNELDPLPRSQAIELVPKVQAAFDRWLETVRAEAKAEALRESASAYPVMLRDMVSRGSVQAWLRARANQYKENQS